MSRFAESSRLSPRSLLGIFLLLIGTAAHAVDLDQAKAEGLVGETMEGYIAAVKEPASAEVQRLVEQINARRRAEYSRIAGENGIEVSQVEALAAKKAIEKTREGGWVRVNGEWRRK